MTAQHSPRSHRRWLAIGSILAVLSLCELRANEWFMKIEGIKGEATDVRFAGWTRLKSVGSLVDRRTNPTNPPTGPASFSCDIQKAIDSASPQLLRSCGTNTTHPQVTLAYVLSSPPATQYRVTLKDVVISSITQNGISGTSLEESVSFRFEKIEWTCFALNDAGGNTGGLTAQFDLAAGKGDLKTRPPFRAIIERLNGRNGVVVTCPVSSGHKYRILSLPEAGKPWEVMRDFTASEDGTSSQFIPIESPSLILRVEEIE